MKLKVSKHKLNIYDRGSPRGSRTQQFAYCLRYAHSQHIESHLGKKKQQAKIPIAFLFSRLHFNNVTSHALFYGGHLVMRSKRCAVQNQGITLNRISRCTKFRKRNRLLVTLVVFFTALWTFWHLILELSFILKNLYTFRTNIVSRSYRIIKGLAPTVIRIWLCFGQRSRFSPVLSVTFTFASLC